MTPTIPDEAVQAAKPTEGYLIVKRDLYYMPNSCGYTGIRDEAGRYSLEFVEALCSHKGDGLSFVHESEAPEFRDAAFHDLVIKHLIKQRDEARAALPFLQGAKVKPLEWFATANGDIVSDSIVGWYRLHMVVANACFRLETPDGFLEYKFTYSHWPEDEAKAAAQADYEARILSAIEVAPSPRAQALEEAAHEITLAQDLCREVCGNDSWREVYTYKTDYYRSLARTAIRALSSQPVANGLEQSVSRALRSVEVLPSSPGASE